MPSAISDGPGLPQVAAVEALLRESLGHAQMLKPASSIEPALNKSDFESLLTTLPTLFTNLPNLSTGQTSDKARQYAVVETAARDIFSNLIVRPYRT